ncbi:HEPN domain-containing protein [Salinibacter ruber]|uniref:HEPN domain-containing protein n=1 Tax=Salinibacter ruber TaxID=146919 RepID=UPI0021671D41
MAYGGTGRPGDSRGDRRQPTAHACRRVSGSLQEYFLASLRAQQCIEKGFKAVLEEHEQEVPNIHNLITLYGRAEERLPDEETIDVDLLERLNQLYIDDRYPGERGLMPEVKPSQEEGRGFRAFAENVLDTIRQHLREKK